MNKYVNVYVIIVASLAVSASIYLYSLNPSLSQTYFIAASCFTLLSILAQSLQHKLVAGTAKGSIAFIPFLSVAIIAPHWVSVVSVAISVGVVEMAVRRSFVKVFFNVMQHVLAMALCILAYLWFEGQSLLSNTDLYVLPYLVLCLTFFTINTVSVSGVVALSHGLKIWDVWQKNTVNAITYDFLSLPFIYGFAWLYVKFGAGTVIFTSVSLLAMRQLYKTNWALKNTNQELLELMVAAIEARDPYTSGHSRRVSRNASIIAQALGLRSRELERVTVAGLLHDVGKIHEIFGPILSKPGKLTPEEHAIMQTHAAKSAELVSKVSSLADIVEPIRHHHENWDGTGYPAKLSGEKIPLISRIIMFADTIDAMTTDRPYRAAMTPADVRAELIKYRGKQFDPNICDMLITSPMFYTLFNSTDSQQHHSAPDFGISVGRIPELSST